MKFQQFTITVFVFVSSLCQYGNSKRTHERVNEWIQSNNCLPNSPVALDFCTCKCSLMTSALRNSDMQLEISRRLQLRRRNLRQMQTQTSKDDDKQSRPANKDNNETLAKKGEKDDKERNFELTRRAEKDENQILRPEDNKQTLRTEHNDDKEPTEKIDKQALRTGDGDKQALRTGNGDKQALRARNDAEQAQRQQKKLTKEELMKKQEEEIKKLIKADTNTIENYTPGLIKCWETCVDSLIL